jgi:hypothetical protein
MDAAIIATYRCNARCRMCKTWQFPTNPSQEFTPELLRKLLHETDSMPCSRKLQWSPPARLNAPTGLLGHAPFNGVRSGVLSIRESGALRCASS